MHVVMRCPSVRLSVTFVSCVKQINISSKFFSPSGCQAILVFLYQTALEYSDANPPTGASNAGGLGKKRDFGRISGFAAYRSTVYCCQPYESRTVKYKAATNGGKRRAEHSPRRPSSVVHTRRRRSVCDGLDVICQRRRSTPPPPPGHKPLVITPVFLLP